jgi:hypothetical protein
MWSILAIKFFTNEHWSPDQPHWQSLSQFCIGAILIILSLLTFNRLKPIIKTKTHDNLQ